MTMSMSPSLMPFFTSASSLPATRREACAIFTGSPRKRSVKVWKCWRASSVVGTTTATCLPASTASRLARKRHLGLAEADIAADQPVHGPAAGEIVEHGVDARGLVLGLLIGEARRELVIEPVGRGDHRRLAQLAHGRDLDQLLGDVADALLELRFSRLPADAAKPVELHAGLVRAVAAQQLDVLDRQIELVAALIDALRGSHAARRRPRWW